MHDYDSCKFYINGQVFNLTENENELLDLFLTHKNKVVTRDMICQRIYGEDFKASQYSAILQRVKRLKDKFGLHIRTAQCRGYILRGGIQCKKHLY